MAQMRDIYVPCHIPSDRAQINKNNEFTIILEVIVNVIKMIYLDITIAVNLNAWRLFENGFDTKDANYVLN